MLGRLLCAEKRVVACRVSTSPSTTSVPSSLSSALLRRTVASTVLPRLCRSLHNCAQSSQECHVGPVHLLTPHWCTDSESGAGNMGRGATRRSDARLHVKRPRMLELASSDTYCQPDTTGGADDHCYLHNSTTAGTGGF